MSNTRTLLSAAASLAASAMLIRSISNDFIPDEVRSYFFSGFHNLFRRFSSQLTIVIEELQGLSVNQLFEAADTYLGNKETLLHQRVRLSKGETEKKLAITMDRNEEIVDVFENVQVRWSLICTKVESSGYSHRHYFNVPRRSEIRSYELSFHKKHKEKVLSSYFPYILERSRVIKEERKVIKLHSNARGQDWCPDDAINLDHPMTFMTLAMDSELKKALVEDLDSFLKGKEFYKRIGKVWKRGYLLYGPPGTGKSSLIAAMANYLNFDIYDLDLTEVLSNSHLRSLLLSVSNRSILVVEDIDCTIKLQNRESRDEPDNHQQTRLTLSGLLNLFDGLLSCCGDQRIIVFTTNYKDRIDPALLRPGRMDMHIQMSYCTFSAFKQLAFNYFGICHHQMFEHIEGLLGVVEVTSAEVAGELMKSSDAEISLQVLVKFLHNKMTENEKAKINKTMEAQKEQEEKETEDMI